MTLLLERGTQPWVLCRDPETKHTRNHSRWVVAKSFPTWWTVQITAVQSPATCKILRWVLLFNIYLWQPKSRLHHKPHFFIFLNYHPLITDRFCRVQIKWVRYLVYHCFCPSSHCLKWGGLFPLSSQPSHSRPATIPSPVSMFSCSSFHAQR